MSEDPNKQNREIDGQKVFDIIVNAIEAAVVKVNDPSKLRLLSLALPTPKAGVIQSPWVIVLDKALPLPLIAVKIAIVEAGYPPVVAIQKTLEPFLYPIRRACGVEAYEAAVEVIKDKYTLHVPAEDRGKWNTLFVYPDEPQAQHTSPCKECAFRRDIEPGALGGSPAEVYIAQCHGPYIIPCHVRHNCGSDEARRNPNNAACAGASVFRANTGRAAELDQSFTPEIKSKFLWLSEDKETVFSTNAEFLAHHKRIPIEEAEWQLKQNPPEVLLEQEMRRPGAKRLKDQPDRS